jgi:putative PIN family toxin of toxin-antitoxin system
MLRVVLDANVFVSGTIQKTGVPAQILDLWQTGQLTLVTSLSLIQEISRVLRYSHIQEKYRLTESAIEILVLGLKSQSIITPEKSKLRVIEDDPDDDKLLIAAIEGQAKYIVSGDYHLRNLKTYQGIEIVSPAEFINLLF